MLPPSPLPCTTIIAQQANLLDLLKTTASVAALPLAGLTFWLGYRQKERERTRGYYHKAVVDVVLPQILETFGIEIDRLREAGRAALEGLASKRKTMPRASSVALSEFTTNLFFLQDAIVERTLIFDEKMTNEIREDFEGIEDKAKGWFGDVVLHKRRNLEELEAILKTGQRTVIKRLYRGEFRDF